jgi:hypothetical protein
VGTGTHQQARGTQGPGDQLFERTLKEQDALYNSAKFDQESEEFQYTREDLENLRLGNLQSPVLEQNPLFVMLRGKLVNFYKRLERLNSDDPRVAAQAKIENLRLKTTLHDSLKKLLRCIILTDDGRLQGSQLNRIYTWYNAKYDALESKEAVQQQKMRDE